MLTNEMRQRLARIAELNATIEEAKAEKQRIQAVVTDTHAKKVCLFENFKVAYRRGDKVLVTTETGLVEVWVSDLDCARVDAVKVEVV